MLQRAEGWFGVERSSTACSRLHTTGGRHSEVCHSRWALQRCRAPQFQRAAHEALFTRGSPVVDPPSGEPQVVADKHDAVWRALSHRKRQPACTTRMRLAGARMGGQKRGCAMPLAHLKERAAPKLECSSCSVSGGVAVPRTAAVTACARAAIGEATPVGGSSMSHPRLQGWAKVVHDMDESTTPPGSLHSTVHLPTRPQAAIPATLSIDPLAAFPS